MRTVEVQGLSKTYADGTLALSGLDLTFGEGLLGLLGPNGAGKTTFLSILVSRSSRAPGRWRSTGCPRACRPTGAG